MHHARLKAIAIPLVIFSSLIAACSIVGPTSITSGRIIYNNVIHATSKEQLLINILRVYANDTPYFIDVSEVDAGFTLQGSLSGGKSGIGAHAGTSGGTLAGEVGAVSGSLAYQETPTIRYLPLQGQPLVEQIATPITTDTIGKLFDSDWALPTILELAADRLTKDYLDYASSLKAISALDNFGVLILIPSATPQAKTLNEGTHLRAGAASVDIGVLAIQTGQTAPKSNALDIYLHKAKPRLRENDESESQEIDRLWARLLKFYGGNVQNNPGTVIEIRTEADKSAHQPPDMRTRSALGILKASPPPDLG